MTNKQLNKLGIHVDDAPEWQLDVVCGMDIDPHTTPYSAEFMGKTYYFCNKSCMDHFKNNPERYTL